MNLKKGMSKVMWAAGKLKGEFLDCQTIEYFQL